VLQALSAGFPVECEAFDLYVKETTVLYLQNCRGTEILIRGAKIIEENVRHVGKVSEETQEARATKNMQKAALFNSSPDCVSAVQMHSQEDG
jgi:hypothetical protein